MRTPSPFWVLSAGEARAHATILCGVLWIVAAVFLLRPGLVDPYGRLKFPDFVHFYTLGDRADAGRFDQLYDADALHQRQVEVVPPSAPLRYIPIYSPQTSWIFMPLARLPYLAAAWIWAGFTALIYALVVRAAWRPVSAALPDWRFVAVAAAAFPPFWSLILHGQTTVVPLAAFALAWMALKRGRAFVAGLALGLLTVKPQFGVVLALVMLFSREWGVMLGAVTSVALQTGIVVWVMGFEALGSYLEAARQIPTVASLLEPKSYQLHSIRAWTQLLPAPVGTAVYGVVATFISWSASRVWRARVPLELRFAAVMLAACLANPHFTVYDATVLAIPMLWIGAWFEEQRPRGLRVPFWPLVYGLFALFLIPSAWLVRVQLSVALQGAIYWLVVQETGSRGFRLEKGGQGLPPEVPEL